MNVNRVSFFFEGGFPLILWIIKIIMYNEKTFRICGTIARNFFLL